MGAALMISVPGTAVGGALGVLTGFRQELYRCLTARADSLFELGDAVLCAEGRPQLDGPPDVLAEVIPAAVAG